MEAKIKVSYLDDRGNKKTKTVRYDFPEKIKEVVIQEFDGVKFDPPLVSSFEKEATMYLGDISYGRQFMKENEDCAIVIDYIVITKKPKVSDKEVIEKFMEMFDSDQAKIDFLAVYKKMEPSLKGIPILKKIRIVILATGTAYDSASEAYNSMARILRGEGSPKVIGNGKIKSVR